MRQTIIIALAVVLLCAGALFLSKLTLTVEDDAVEALGVAPIIQEKDDTPEVELSIPAQLELRLAELDNSQKSATQALKLTKGFITQSGDNAAQNDILACMYMEYMDDTAWHITGLYKDLAPDNKAWNDALAFGFVLHIGQDSTWLTADPSMYLQLSGISPELTTYAMLEASDEPILDDDGALALSCDKLISRICSYEALKDADIPVKQRVNDKLSFMLNVYICVINYQDSAFLSQEAQDSYRAFGASGTSQYCAAIAQLYDMYEANGFAKLDDEVMYSFLVECGVMTDSYSA